MKPWAVASKVPERVAIWLRKLRVSRRRRFSVARRETTIPLSESICSSTLCSFYLFDCIAKRGLGQRPSRAALTPRPVPPSPHPTLTLFYTFHYLNINTYHERSFLVVFNKCLLRLILRLPT